MDNIINNPSWPAGKWELKYDNKKDVYIIKTEYGQIIAQIGPTLVAHWMVEVFNAIIGGE